MLTAAHCRKAYPLNYDVYIGSHFKSEMTDGAERIPVAERVPHPNYDGESMLYDLMMVKLAFPVQNLTPVALNEDKSRPAKRELLTTMGFGATRYVTSCDLFLSLSRNQQPTLYNSLDYAFPPSHEGIGSYSLKKVKVKAIGRKKCNKLYPGEITDSIMMCAGTRMGGRDSCQVCSLLSCRE